MKLDPGGFDQLVTFQHRQVAQDALGANQGAWQNLLGEDLWAKAEPLRAREFFAASAGQQQQAVDVRFVVYHREEIAATTRPLRIIWNGRPHDVVGRPIDVDGQSTYLECMAVAGVRDGR